MKLLDTSVVVDVDRGGIDDKVSRLDDEGRHAISTVTLTELRLGVNKQYERGTDAHQSATDDLERLCARFELLPADRAVAIAAANIIDDLRQRGVPLHDLHDVYIAATARSEQLTVLTGNVDHFDRIDDVSVESWMEY